MKINTQAQAQGFMYGLQALRFKGKIIGYIEKGSFDFGGAKGETVDVEAEQVPDAPVWTLQQSNATIKPKFNLIQLQYENLQMLLGGSLIKESDKVVGWAAPVDLEQISGEMPDRHSLRPPHRDPERNAERQFFGRSDDGRGRESGVRALGAQARGRRCSLSDHQHPGGRPGGVI